MLLGTDGVGFAADSSIDKLTAKNWQPVPCGRQSLLCKSDRKAPQVSSAAGNQSALKWEEMPSRVLENPCSFEKQGKVPSLSQLSNYSPKGRCQSLRSSLQFSAGAGGQLLWRRPTCPRLAGRTCRGQVPGLAEAPLGEGGAQGWRSAPTAPIAPVAPLPSAGLSRQR